VEKALSLPITRLQCSTKDRGKLSCCIADGTIRENHQSEYCAMSETDQIKNHKGRIIRSRIRIDFHCQTRLCDLERQWVISVIDSISIITFSISSFFMTLNVCFAAQIYLNSGFIVPLIGTRNVVQIIPASDGAEIKS
jgi:hypothetical protein